MRDAAQVELGRNGDGDRRSAREGRGRGIGAEAVTVAVGWLAVSRLIASCGGTRPAATIVVRSTVNEAAVTAPPAIVTVPLTAVVLPVWSPVIPKMVCSMR